MLPGVKEVTEAEKEKELGGVITWFSKNKIELEEKLKAAKIEEKIKQEVLIALNKLP